MVLDTLEYDFLNLMGPAYRGHNFQTMISSFSANNDVQMIIGATGGDTDFNIYKSTVALRNETNAAYVYNIDGKQFSNRYDKIHLVPFGEFVPFKYSAPWLYSRLMKLTPYPDSDFSLKAGTEYYTYTLNDKGEDYNYGILICYEDTVSRLARKMVVNSDYQKRVDWLVNISNDGWFAWRDRKDCDVGTTTELVQHAIICSFRAIENRVAIVRSVNTGVSCFIEPTGKIVNDFAFGNLPVRAFDRRGVKGYIADNVVINDTVTFFSKYGQWLDYVCGIFIWPIMVLAFGKIKEE
jgi:apolipoprotein N-acyltransferase